MEKYNKKEKKEKRTRKSLRFAFFSNYPRMRFQLSCVIYISLQANWYRASQYCRYHGMHLASIASQEENDRLEKHIKDFGLGHEHFWTSGTDQAEEGTFFWMANGRPITFENWNVGEPNNFRYNDLPRSLTPSLDSVRKYRNFNFKY